MKTNAHRNISALVFLLAATFAGCGENTKQAPPKQQVQDAVRAAMPPFISLYSLEMEPISTGTDAAKVNFKAVVTPREDLYRLDRKVNGNPTVTLLKVVQTAGSKATVYGTIEAQRNMDKWTLKTPELQSGYEQFGRPKGSFDAQSFALGSAEANDALKQQAVNAEQEAKDRKALLEKQEKLEQDFQSKRQQDQQANKRALLEATAPGRRYVGSIAWRQERQRLRLVFSEQKGFLLQAEASNPDKPSEKQTFAGELNFDPRPDENSRVTYSILLSPIRAQTAVSGRWEFYQREGSLSLNTTDSGLEGEANIGGRQYQIRLQKEK